VRSLRKERFCCVALWLAVDFVAPAVSFRDINYTSRSTNDDQRTKERSLPSHVIERIINTTYGFATVMCKLLRLVTSLTDIVQLTKF